MSLENIPVINEPIHRSKFVQIYVDGEPYLRFGRSYHRYILLDFIRECRDAGQPLISAEEFEQITRDQNTVPTPKELGRYTAVGMGLVTIGRTINLFDESMDYGLQPDQEHIDAISKKIPDYEFKVKRY